MKDVVEAARHEPIRLRYSQGVCTIGAVVGYGDVCNVYRAEPAGLLKDQAAVFKIGRDRRANPLLRYEARALRCLGESPQYPQFAPFFPRMVDALEVIESDGAEQRVGNLLALSVRPEELYTLAEVRTFFPDGLDPRDMAWIWRRILNALVFMHGCGVSHNAVLPVHVLIEPNEHKLVLVGWCAAHTQGPPGGPKTISGAYADWYRGSTTVGPATDISLGARTMIDLLGGDGAAATAPVSLDPALRRYFKRCIEPTSLIVGAARLLEDFDRLIEALWGPRQFRALRLPPR